MTPPTQTAEILTPKTVAIYRKSGGVNRLTASHEALRAQRADLLEALEGLLPWMKDHDDCEPTDCAIIPGIRRAREALARTRGGGGAHA